MRRKSSRVDPNNIQSCRFGVPLLCIYAEKANRLSRPLETFSTCVQSRRPHYGLVTGDDSFFGEKASVEGNTYSAKGASTEGASAEKSSLERSMRL